MANLLGKRLTREELLKRVGNIEQIARIRAYGMSRGKADGLRAFGITTGGGLDFTVLEDKCLDISNMSYKGINLNFTAKPGLVSSKYYNPHGNEFGRSFQAGMLYTCGLSNVGTACMDDGAEQCTHGRIGNTPADGVRAEAFWEKDEYVLEVSGEMREAALFSENLVLKRKVSTRLGAKTISIHDEVENQGFEDQALMILYHFNLGYPMLDDCSRLVLPAVETMPRDDEAKKGAGEHVRFSTPVDHFKEQVFYHKSVCDEKGNTYAGLVNDGLQLGVYVKFNTKQLPRLIQWKSMMSGDYALGIEPANCLVEGRAKERERGTLKRIAPMEKAVFDLELGVLDGKREIGRFEKLVGELAHQP